MEDNQINRETKIMGKNLIKLLGLPQLLTGIFCIVGLIFLSIYGTYPQELSMLYFQMAFGATGGVSILLGLESIVFMSKEKRGVQNALIFDILISTILGIALVATARKFAGVYLGEIIMGSEPDLWDESVLSFYRISYNLGIAASLVIAMNLFLLAYLLYRNIVQ